jgi:hypothetical protein
LSWPAKKLLIYFCTDGFRGPLENSLLFFTAVFSLQPVAAEFLGKEKDPRRREEMNGTSVTGV